MQLQKLIDPEIAPISQRSQLYPAIWDACDSRKLPKNPPKHRNPLIKIDFPLLILIRIQKQCLAWAWILDFGHGTVFYLYKS